MRKQFTILLILVFVFGLAPTSRAEDLGGKLKGRILLQVESKGEAWYVNPDNSKRYYLGRPDDAFKVMRELGLGISNKDFNSFNGVTPKRLSGKILIKVEDSGKAYYVNPTNLKMHFLGKPTDAFTVMRNLGLGTSNSNLDKIAISEKSTPPPTENVIVKGIEYPKTITTPNTIDNVSNFLNVAVALYQTNIDYAQSVIDRNAEAKIYYREIGQIWKDELIRNNIYRITYPDDTQLAEEAKIYQLLINLSDTGIQLLNEKDYSFVKIKEIVQEKINDCKSRIVTQNEIQQIFTDANNIHLAIKHFADLLKEEYKKYNDANHNAAVALDAAHSVQIAKQQQEVNEINALMAETDRILAYSQASLIQAQNQVNAMRASLPIYCTVTNMAIGSVQVQCHQ